MIKLETSHPCVKFLQGPPRVCQSVCVYGGGLVGGTRWPHGGKQKEMMTFFCVVENVEGGVRSHPVVINLLAVRRSDRGEYVQRGEEWRVKPGESLIKHTRFLSANKKLQTR